jgi:hypothetical protein
MITSQWHCPGCNSYFEAVREEFDDPAPAAPTAGPPGAG